MKQRPIRGADLFCGSGGFSTGLVRACERLFPGRPLDLVAVNHWQVAIDTHQLNHPGIRHFCADLEHLKPRDAVPGGVLDILLAAPTCTYHSRARGGKPVHDQQRMDPWHVVRWCTDLRVYRVLVENVPEFVEWGPCDARTGKPIKARKGEYFRAWLAAMKAIGFRFEWKILICANYGDATTRARWFGYGRSDKKALRFPEPSHARGGETDLLGTREPWRGAAEIIDWSRPGKSIFTRKRALVQNTISRLRAGAERNSWPRQHIEALQALIDGKSPRLQVTKEEAEIIALQLGIPLVMATGGGGTARGVDQPIPTVTAGGHNGVTPHFAEPVIVNRNNNERTIGATGVDLPTPTVTTRGAGYLAQPILLHKMNSDGGRSGRGIDEPTPTLTTQGAPSLVQPIIAPYYGGGSGLTAKGANEPLPAQRTKDCFALASPTVFRVNQGDGRRRGITSGRDPVPTLTASESLGVATPTLIRAGHGDDGHSHEGRVLDAADPVPSITGSNEIGVAVPFLVPNFGEDGHQSPRTHDIDKPVPTITATGHIQLAQAIISPCTHHDTSNRVRGADEPLPTVTGANRGELTLSQPFVSLCTHGNESNPGRSVCEPVPTVTTAKGGEMTLATPAIVEGYYIDILYRMLHWSELSRATSFEDQGRTYQFTGNATEITKQIGNAVPIRTGTALCAEALEGL
jgi:DNA (cytosine-5)-methyltransferase 1